MRDANEDVTQAQEGKGEPALRAFLTNCLVGGHTTSEHEGTWYRDTITFELEGRAFVLKQHADVIRDRRNFVGIQAVTSEVLVFPVTPTDVEEVLTVIERLCWLLSLACLSPVSIHGHDYPAGKFGGARHTTVGVGQYFRPTIHIRDGAAVKSFVEQTYPAFVHLEDTRQLKVVIDYLNQAETDHLPTECQLVFACVLLENLKHSYAVEVGIPFVKGHFRVSNNPKADTVAFSALLTKMFQAVGMKPVLKPIVEFRNTLLHQGLSGKSHQENDVMYDKMHDVLREYLLRLLDFHGSFPTYASRGNAQMQI